MQTGGPLDEKTFDILRFLSGYGWWLLLAVALIILFIYKKIKKP